MPETYPDIPRPGDPTFTSFPKSLPDDCVQYTLHILTVPPLAVPALRSRLLEVKRAADALCKRLLGEYIWQREVFNLELTGPQWHLRGSTSFGDSIADEWLVVYLLRELSKQFEDAWVRVVDADGEFLLIEAANTLPRWLNPEIADHRVWLNKGQLRIIPRETTVALTGTKRPRQPAPRNLTLDDALGRLLDNNDTTIHSPLIEEEAFYRLRNYPAAIADSMHNTILTIPRKLAYILHRASTHISPAVEAFYLRDPISLRPLQEKGGGKLRFPPKDCVTTSVKFTRVGFAQLKSQEFSAPTTWSATLEKDRNLDSKERESRIMGMKLTCGFEMLIADPQNRDKRAVREMEMLLEDVESGEEVLPADDEVKKWSRREDEEGWLDVNFEDFERELSGRGRSGRADIGNNRSGTFGDKTAQENLRRMVERFEQFLNDDDAGPDGVDPDDMDFDDDDNDNKDNDDDDDDDDDDDEGDGDNESEDPEEDRHASFDEEEFAKMMKEMMGMSTVDKMSYGQIHYENRAQEVNADDKSDDEESEEDLKTVMRRMEDELREAGALDLIASSSKVDETATDSRYHLAKNLLESFKGQGGGAGPTGNMMDYLGIKLPRDDGK